MLDSVTLKIQPAITPREPYSRTEYSSGYKVNGRVRNLILTSSDEYSILTGSIPKFRNGSNIETLRFSEIASTINELENELQCDIGNAQILGLEWSSTIQTDYQPKVYYPTLGQTWPFERVPFKNSLYFNSSKRRILFYDKGKEARSPGNLLRYELSLPKAKNLGLTLVSLTKPEAFNQLTKSWLDVYLSINKIKKPMPKEVKTPTDLNRFFQSLGIEVLGGKDEALQLIDNLHRLGKIKDYNKTRMRQNLIDFVSSIGAPTDLEIELNHKFTEVANQNTQRIINFRNQA